jgi:cytochrome c oxidase subunit II
MYAKLHVVDGTEFAKRPWDVWLDSTPAEAAKSGENLYKQLCASCHTVNGAPGVGPTWKGLFTKQGDAYVGRQREVIEGGAKKTITVDDKYLTDSIQKPDLQKVAEEPYVKNNMTAFPNLDERRVKGLIQYMKSLADAK